MSVRVFYGGQTDERDPKSPLFLGQTLTHGTAVVGSVEIEEEEEERSVGILPSELNPSLQ